MKFWWSCRHYKSFFKGKHKQLPANVQQLLTVREGEYNFRLFQFDVTRVRVKKKNNRTFLCFCSQDEMRCGDQEIKKV